MNDRFKSLLVTVILCMQIPFLWVACDGGSEKKPQIEFTLPEQIKQNRMGWSRYLTPSQLRDSVENNRGLRVYYMDEPGISANDYLVPLKGMETVSLSSCYYMPDTLSKERPIVLISEFGDDCKRMAKSWNPYGIDVYLIAGGMYALWKEQRHAANTRSNP